MTIGFIWLDRSYSTERVVALADSRASIRGPAGRYTPYTNAAVKLFRVPVQCRPLSLDTNGLFPPPYWQTEVGIALAGQCFEALSVIALAERCLFEIVDVAGTRMAPTPADIVDLVRQLSDRFFDQHLVPANQEFDLVLFGYFDGAPWAKKLEHRPGQSTRAFDMTLTGRNLFVLGTAGGESRLEEALTDLKNRIGKHKAGMKIGRFVELFDFDLEAARHETAEVKQVEKHLLRIVLKDTFGDVGGPVSALEAFPSSNGARLAFSYSEPSIVADLPVLNSGLAIMPTYKAFG